jgi:hypothetical protein
MSQEPVPTIEERVRALSTEALISWIVTWSIRGGKLLAAIQKRKREHKPLADLEALEKETTSKWVRDSLFYHRWEVVEFGSGIYMTQTDMGLGLNLKSYPIIVRPADDSDLRYCLDNELLREEDLQDALIRLIGLLELSVV